MDFYVRGGALLFYLFIYLECKVQTLCGDHEGLANLYKLCFAVIIHFVFNTMLNMSILPKQKKKKKDETSLSAKRTRQVKEWPIKIELEECV